MMQIPTTAGQDSEWQKNDCVATRQPAILDRENVDALCFIGCNSILTIFKTCHTPEVSMEQALFHQIRLLQYMDPSFGRVNFFILGNFFTMNAARPRPRATRP
jgi:hypothetical protein